MKLAELKDGRVLTAHPSATDVAEPDVSINIIPSMHAEAVNDVLELSWHEARDLRDMLGDCLEGRVP